MYNAVAVLCRMLARTAGTTARNTGLADTRNQSDPVVKTVGLALHLIFGVLDSFRAG